MDDDFIVALHEAGHAVMAHRFNRGPMKIELFERDGVTWGSTSSKTGLYPEEVDPSDPTSVTEVMQCIACALGGIAAELLHSGKAAGCGDDYEEALTLLRYFKPEATPTDLDSYFLAAQKFLSDQETWGAVLELAEVLCKKRKLSGYGARQVIRNSDRAESAPLPLAGKFRFVENQCG